jgi:DNA-binding MarR family transcriptional regulator
MHISPPIGYWLKHLDRLIDTSLDRCLGPDLTRRHWQVLNLLAQQPARPAELRSRLAPFLLDEPEAETAVTAELIGRGWVSDQDGLLRLTETGREAHAVILADVSRARRKTVQGISDEEYRATLDVLRRMAANLEG